MARARKKGRWLLPSRGRSRSRIRAKVERRGGTRHEPAREDGEFMEISLSETVMHVSPISVTKRLLATFCPRDNSPLFFMATPISSLKNYSQEVHVFRNVKNMTVFKYT